MVTIEEYETRLHDFCVAATVGRDPSHSFVHMDCVKHNSLLIWNHMKNLYDSDAHQDRIHRLVIAVAQLHDVADHKYGNRDEQEQKMHAELSTHFNEQDVELIMRIIANISFSTEEKMRKSGIIPNWEELGEEGKLVRNIVSDADKLEAIGLIGVERCMQYTAETMHAKGCEAPLSLLVQQLIDHGKEKLFRLKDEFIVTAKGKELAAPLHDDMMKRIDELKSEVGIASD